MKITYDVEKDTEIVVKHHVSLAQATFLDWSNALIWPDQRHDYGEDRQVALAPMNQRLYFVVFVDRKTVRRIISLRKANKGNLTIMNKKLIRPTDAEDALINAAAMTDADAMPFTDMEWEQVKPQLHRGPGRPLGSGTKAQVTLRLDLEVIETLKATGPGWQTRANEVLRNWAHSKH